jgi:glycosyltransferase involved in cell wall biosynthesis
MRVLINALSVTNLSGRHVLLGHLSKLSEWTMGEHEYIVLYHKGNKDIRQDLGKNVGWIKCPGYTARWIGRVLWEQMILPLKLSKLDIDFVFLLSGTIIPFLQMPQVSYAMNPVPLIKRLAKSGIESLKIHLQRAGYKIAMRKALMIVFLSEYMRQAYRENAGIKENASVIAYTGIDDDTFKAAEILLSDTKKKPYQIVSVSAMAPHKGVETVIKAVEYVKRLYGIPIRLLLIGPWPDYGYESKIRSLVTKMELNDSIEFKGYVSRDALNRYYAESKIFCLMSKSESFGIPAIEAQAFGNPVVSSNCCAIPEVCGQGGVYLASDDYEGTAQVLARLLVENESWEALSEAAKKNAIRYRWDICTKPLLQMFNIMADRVKH